MNYISQQEPNQMWIKKVLMLVLADILIVLISYFMALLLRFDFVFSSIPEEYLMGYLWSMPFWIISTIVIFYICRLYHSIWRLASVAELQMILIAYSILAVVYSLGMLFMQMHMPRSYYFIGFLLNFLMTTGLRFSYRLMRFWVNSRNTNADAGGEMHAKDHVMVIGAGAAGQVLIKEIINSKKLNIQVVCIIDDNPTKHGSVLEGITIVGDRYSIPEMAKKYKVDRIIYAIPEAAADDRKAILNICKDTGCRLQTVPGVYQLVNGEVSVSRLRNVEITDLLGRAQVQVNMDEIYSSIQGKILLVTGGGGSIGSELCRQIAASHPKKLIIFDMYENNAYEIQQELRRKYGDSLDLEVLIGSVRNTNRVRSIMQKYKPDIVFHAAAHKHVPLMEDSPNEAIKNNVMGTYKTAVAASRAGVKKFVLISTDKAVNPTNIMGASKRLCEMVVQMMNRQCKDTDFVAVRFGNVLGSNGSVIPLFKKQIHEFQAKMPEVADKIKFYIGDVRDLESVKGAMHGVDYIFHAAALKQVPSCEFFPMEAVRTNVIGTDNVLTAAIEAGVESVICLSTDKAAYPINAMGITKAIEEKVAVAKSRMSGKTKICCTRYGNVMCSRGSVIPLWIDQIRNGNPITLTEPSMTRFIMSLEEAVDLVLFAFENGENGDLLIQKAPACTIQTQAEAVCELFGGKKEEIKVIGIRHGEKMYETLLTNEECAKAVDMGNFYRVPADNRGLNYDKYFKEGDEKRNTLTEFNSNNTRRLNLEETKEKIASLAYIQEELAKM